jgi:anti-sigma factor RsiW
MKIDEEKLMAFADGELQGAERDAVERALAEDPALREQLEEQSRLREALTRHYGPVAGEEVPERLLATLGASKAEGVASLSAMRERRRLIQRPAWRDFGAIAATLAVGIIAGQLIPSRGTGMIGTENGTLVAKGDLAGALETQLASAQAPDAATRIGVTFPDKQGRLCRTFEAVATSGLACRTGDHWTVVVTAAPQGHATEYRQAGSSLVLQAAQEMMGDVPLDAAAEKAAMAADWKISATAAD